MTKTKTKTETETKANTEAATKTTGRCCASEEAEEAAEAAAESGTASSGVCGGKGMEMGIGRGTQRSGTWRVVAWGRVVREAIVNRREGGRAARGIVGRR